MLGSGNPLKDYLATNLAGIVPQPPAPTAMGPTANPADRAQFLMAAAVARAKQRQQQEQQAQVQQRAAPTPNPSDRAQFLMAAAVARAQQRRQQQDPQAQPQPDPIAQNVERLVTRRHVINDANAQGTVDPALAQPRIGPVPYDPPIGRMTPTPNENDIFALQRLITQAAMAQGERRTQADIDAGGGDPLANAVQAVPEAAKDYGQGVGTAVGEGSEQFAISGAKILDDPSLSTIKRETTPITAAGLGIVGAAMDLPGITKPQEWVSSGLGELAYIAASGGEMPSWVNGIPEGPEIWRTITGNVRDQKEEIVAAHDAGGGRAVYDDVFTNTEGAGFWSALALEMSAAALTDPLTYAGLASMSSGNIVRLLEQKLASGLELTAAEKAIYTAAKGAHVVTTVPNALADAPINLVGKIGSEISQQVAKVTAGRVDPAAITRPTSESLVQDTLTQGDEAFQAITAARAAGDITPTGAAPQPTAADEARLIQRGARLPQQPTIEPPTTGQTQPAAKGSGQYESARMGGGNTPEFVILGPDRVVVETVTKDGIKTNDGTLVRPIPKGSTVGVEVAKRKRELNTELLGKQEAGIDVPGTPAQPLTIEQPPAADPLAGHWINPKTGRKDPQRVMEKPSLYEHIDNEVRPAAPELADAFDAAYKNDPRLVAFQEKMRQFDEQAQQVARADAQKRGRNPETVQGFDTPEKVLEGIKHRVEVQNPIYRQTVGMEPPDFRFDYGEAPGTSKAVPPKSKVSRQSDEREVVERAVFGTNDEASRARQYLHMQIGDLSGQTKQTTDQTAKATLIRRQAKYQTLLDETSRLRQAEAEAGGLKTAPVATEVPARPLPPIDDTKYRRPMSHFTDTIYREVDADELGVYLPGAVDQTLPDMFVSNTADLATGQGRNAGALLEFSSGDIQGMLSRRKPTWQVSYGQGQAEFTVRNTTTKQIADSLMSVTITADALDNLPTHGRKNVLRARMDDLRRKGWTETTSADGSITFRRPDTEPTPTAATSPTGERPGVSKVETPPTQKTWEPTWRADLSPARLASERKAMADAYGSESAYDHFDGVAHPPINESLLDELVRGEGGEWTDLPPGTSLVASQEWVSPEAMAKLRREGVKNPRTPVIIVKKNGVSYLVDGHHRALLSRERGQPVRAFVRDLDTTPTGETTGIGQTTPTLNPQAQEVPNGYVPLSEADRMFDADRISAEERDFLNRPLNVGFGDDRTPMAVLDLMNENAAALGEVAGWKKTRDQIEVLERERLGMRNAPPDHRAGKIALGAWKGANTTFTINKEMIQYNMITGPKRPLSDAISETFILSLTGHGWAAIQQFRPRNLIATFRAVRDGGDTALLNQLGVADPIRQSGEFLPMDVLPRVSRGDTPNYGETTLQQNLMKLTGGRGKRLTGTITGAFANRTIKDLVTAGDANRRMVVFIDQWRTLYGDARASWEGLARKRGGANGEAWIADTMDAARARVEAEGDRWSGTFSPEDVYRATGDEDLKRAWKNHLSRIKREAKVEVDRVQFSYRYTNADQALSNVAFFHYWQSRAIPLHVRTAIKNPWLMAAYWRTWKMLEQKAEDEGYPKSVKGYLRFMGDSAHGWYSLFDPVGVVVPYRIFIDSSPKEDAPWWERLIPFINPWVEGAAAAAGLTENVPDVTTTSSVRNAAIAVFDWGNAHGLDLLPGGDAPITDPIRTIEKNVYTFINDVLRGGGVPVKGYGPYDPRDTKVVNLRDRVEQIATDQWGPRQGWMPEQTAQVTDAKIRVGVDANGNPLSEQAWDDYTDAQMGTQAARFVTPGGVRTINADLTGRREDSGIFHDNLKTGATSTPEQEAAADAMGETNAGSTEAMTLGTEQNAYHAIGTERQQNLSKGWSNIAKSKDLPMGTYTIGGRTYYTNVLTAMPEEQRELLADQWVRENDGTAELRTYREERDAYVAAHPEYQGYDTYQSSVYQWEGGPRAFRLQAVQDHPEFADELDQQRKTYQKQGKKGEILETELDEWTVSAAGYNAFRAVRQSIYDDAPKDAYNPSKDAFGGSWGAAKGVGTGSGNGNEPYSKVASLKKQLATYQAKMTMFSDLVGMDASKMNPYSAQAYSNTGEMPKPSSDLLLYLEWGESQPAGEDNTVEAYVAYLDELEDAA